MCRVFFVFYRKVGSSRRFELVCGFFVTGGFYFVKWRVESFVSVVVGEWRGWRVVY